MWSENTASAAIIHVDCDAFFTSVEQALNPELKGKPVVTGKERGIVACASYEAKALGIRRPMRLFEAQKMCAALICLPSDYESYSLFSKRLYGILRRFTPDVEEYSIDEAFADLSGLRRIHRASYREIALKIKNTIESELGLTVSIGLAPTKSLAKIGSKQNKPAGFTSVSGHELDHFLKDMPTNRVCGFGPNSTALLAKNGVYSVLDYILRPKDFAKKLLGKIGVELWHELRGEPVYPIAKGAGKNQASLSKTKTFTPPSEKKDFVRAQLLRNVESAFIKLRRHGLRARLLSVYLTTHEFKTSGLSAELSRSTASTHEAARIASGIFEAVYVPRTRYRQTGVVLNDLDAEEETQYDLFEDRCRVKALREISRVVDEVNSLYGKHTLHLGSTDCLNQYRQHLGDRGDMSRRKSNPLKGENFRRHVGLPLWNVPV